MATTLDQARKYVATQDWLRNAGIPGQVIPWASAQVWHESNGGNSNVAKQNLNYSGIIWLNKPTQKATKGTARPKSEGGYYAKYASQGDWARNFARILSLSPGRPVDATSLMDFVARLKKNRYFAASEASYYQALKKILDSFATTVPEAQHAKEEARVRAAYDEAGHYKGEAQRLADKVNFGLNLNYKTWGAVTWGGIGLAALILLSRRN